MNINRRLLWEAFIDKHVKTGRYLSASELVREVLRLPKEKEDSVDRREFTEFDDVDMSRHLENVKFKGCARLAGQQ